MKKRKIIQLLKAHNYDEFIALCDDGTVWHYQYGHWVHLPTNAVEEWEVSI